MKKVTLKPALRQKDPWLKLKADQSGRTRTMPAKEALCTASPSESGPALAPPHPCGEDRADLEGEAGRAGKAVGRHACHLQESHDRAGATLSNEKRNLLSVAYRNVVGGPQVCLRVISSKEQRIDTLDKKL